MKHVGFLAALALLLLVPAPAAFAQSEKKLTERELAKFIDDWPAVVKWLESKGRQFDSAAASAAPAALFFGADYGSFIRGKGWTEDRFAYVAGTVFALTAYLTLEKQNPEVLKQLDEAIAQIKANPGLSAAEKAEGVKGLEEAKKAMLNLPAEAKLDEGELKLVRAKHERLAALLGSAR